MRNKHKQNLSQLLIGLVSWVILGELEKLSSPKDSFVKYSDLKDHIIRESKNPASEVSKKLDDFFKLHPQVKNFAKGHMPRSEDTTTSSKETRWHYYLGWGGTILKRLNYREGKAKKGHWIITEDGLIFLQNYRNKGKKAIEKLADEEKKRRIEKNKKDKQTTKNQDTENMDPEIEKH